MTRGNHKTGETQLCPLFETCQIPGIMNLIRMAIDNPEPVREFLDKMDKADKKGCDDCTCGKGEG